MVVKSDFLWGERVRLSGLYHPPHTVSYASDSANGKLISVRIVGIIVAVSALGLWGAVNLYWGTALLILFQIGLIAMALWRAALITASRFPAPRPDDPQVLSLIHI